MLAVVVQIIAHPGEESSLIEALRENARHSREEPGCLKWEWSRHREDPSRFTLYEVYADEEAFRKHKASEHFATWVETGLPCIEEKTAGQFDLSDPDDRAYTG